MSSSMPSRSASCFVAKPARGFQLLRIDGYSCTKELPGGERVTSDVFTVGGCHWCVDYYPNGADASADESDAIALYLRLIGTTPSGGGGGDYPYHYHQIKERVRARYKFSLLDLATGDAAYERPEETGVFTFAGHQPAYGGAGGQQAAAGGGDVGCGYAAFITRQELEGLLREDCLAIRCDVGVLELEEMPLGGKYGRRRMGYYGYGYGGGGVYDYSDDMSDDYDEALHRRGGSRSRRQPEPDDKEYIRKILAEHRRRK